MAGKVRRGALRQGLVRRGVARLGRRGLFWRGTAWRGMVWLAGRGEVWRGRDWIGEAWQAWKRRKEKGGIHMVYEYKVPYAKVSAQEAGEELARIECEHGGLTPELVVDASR